MNTIRELFKSKESELVKLMKYAQSRLKTCPKRGDDMITIVLHGNGVPLKVLDDKSKPWQVQSLYEGVPVYFVCRVDSRQARRRMYYKNIIEQAIRRSELECSAK